MQSHTSRFGRWPLALVLVAFTACVVHPATTAPRITRPSRQAVDGTGVLAGSSRGAKASLPRVASPGLTAVTLMIDANATAGMPNGSATMTGTVQCSRAGDRLGVVVDLQQEQTAGKSTTVVRGSGGADVTCTTSAQPWSAAVTPTSGAFVPGAAEAAALTNAVPVWVTPMVTSRPVKLARPRR